MAVDTIMADDIASGIATELARGATIGRYLVLSLLGKGGMGEVYAAYDPELDRKVAIKVLRASSTVGVDAAEARGRILREAQALAQLSDPNVVAVYDVGTFGERVFLAMEFVDGSTLSYWQHSQVRSWREIIEVYVGAGRGLAAAHRRGLIHRDFKPENAMVGRDGQVRVMDFGLARSEAAPASVATAAADAARASGSLRLTTSRVAAMIGATLSGSTPRPPAGGGAMPPLALGPVPLVSVEIAEARLDATRSTARAAPPTPRETWLSPSASAGGQRAGGDWQMVTRDLAGPADLDLSAGPAPSALISRLTQTGAMMGTPAYMAPEQFAGHTADAKSDQFSFCIALYEGLYSERPFVGNSMTELTHQVMAGRVRAAPPGTRVPGWLRKVLLCGLRLERDERHASMEVLLKVLARDPGRRGRRYAAGASLAGVLALLAGGLIQSSRQQKVKCLGAEAKLAGVWEVVGRAGVLTPRKEAIRRAFMATGKGYAAGAFTLAMAGLDRQVGAWSAMHRDACEATHLRGEQSSEVLDLRMACLQDRLNDVRALTTVFSEANGDVVSKSAEAVGALHSVEPCADVVALKAVVRPPEDPAVRRAVADVRVRLAEVKALDNAGQSRRAVARIGQVLMDARKTQYDPVIAEALLESAEASADSGDQGAAVPLYRDAFWLAESSRHDEVAVLAAAELVHALAYSSGPSSEVELWARHAAAILGRLGPGHAVVAGWLANNRAAAYEKEGRLAEALASGLDAIRIKEHALGGAHFDVALSYSNVANSLLRLGRIDEALEKNTHALAILENTLGPDHPITAISLAVGAEIMVATGRWQGALTMAEPAIVVLSREWGPDHPVLGYPLTSLGTALVELGRAEQALPHLERALELREAKDPEPRLLGETRFALARALSDVGRSPGRTYRLAELAELDLARNQDLSTKQRASEVGRWRRARWGSSGESTAATVARH